MALEVGTRVRVVAADNEEDRFLIGYVGTILAVIPDAARPYHVDSWAFEAHEIEEV